MSTQSLLRKTFAVALLSGAFAAHAGSVVFDGWAYPNGNSVVVTGFSGQAGGFAVSLSGYGALDGVYDSYCVELTEHISLNASYVNNYSVVSAASYFTPTKLATLTKLISYVEGQDVFAAATSDSQQSTALQLAIWNTVYDTDSTLNIGGAFSETTTTFKTGAAAYSGVNTLLSASQTFSGGPAYELFVLSSGRPVNKFDGNQDQLIWRLSTVPEPTTLALVGFGLGAAGWVRRRRKIGL
jgi:hypothetical protein